MTPDDLTSRAQGEAERRWPREGQPTTNAGNPVTPQGWLDEGMASGFVLGAQWAAAQAPSVEALTAEVERLTVHLADAVESRGDWAAAELAQRTRAVALAARIDRLRAGIEGLARECEIGPEGFRRVLTPDDLRALLAEDEGGAAK